ncbi:unnamed protein product [Brassica napus]|uniref:(rape) hypothetical protein n=1 Tax=Brassica napus TaxID=3708 RepID=A0A816RFM5_BRANA|nr:unnamed protein product [Brassica napus]
MGGTCHPLAGSTSAPDSIVHEFSQKAFRKDATFVDLICLNLPPCMYKMTLCSALTLFLSVGFWLTHPFCIQLAAAQVIPGVVNG